MLTSEFPGKIGGQSSLLCCAQKHHVADSFLQLSLDVRCQWPVTSSLKTPVCVE